MMKINRALDRKLKNKGRREGMDRENNGRREERKWEWDGENTKVRKRRHGERK